MVVVTEELLFQARIAGACDTVKRIKPGTPISSLWTGDLEWFGVKYPDIAKRLSRALTNESEVAARGVPPLELFGSGDGCGSGSGYGYGYGSGSGYGYGYGSGSGDGCGSGSGYGYGYGSGYGSGYGDGSGYGIDI